MFVISNNSLYRGSIPYISSKQARDIEDTDKEFTGETISLYAYQSILSHGICGMVSLKAKHRVAWLAVNRTLPGCFTDILYGTVEDSPTVL